MLQWLLEEVLPPLHALLLRAALYRRSTRRLSRGASCS